MTRPERGIQEILYRYISSGSPVPASAYGFEFPKILLKEFYNEGKQIELITQHYNTFFVYYLGSVYTKSGEQKYSRFTL